MKKITEKDIDRSFDSLKGRKDPLRFLLEKLREEQPDIYDYLQEVEDDYFSSDEREMLIHTVLTGWDVIKSALNRNRQISSLDLDFQLERNTDLQYDILENRERNDKSFIESFYQDNNQPFLMDFLISLYIELPDDLSGSIREEAVPSMIVHTKTVVDCLLMDEDKLPGGAGEGRKYSEEDFSVMKERIASLFEKFKGTSRYRNFNNREKEEAEFIITVFSEMMYNYFLLLPENWESRAVSKCCTFILPGKVMGGDEFFGSVEPVLRAFMLFGYEEGIIPLGKSIAEEIAGIGEAILEASYDPSTWGAGKALLKEAEGEGVDLGDESELKDYIENRQFNAGRDKKPDLKLVKKTGRNEPCPCGSGKKYKKCCGVI